MMLIMMFIFIYMISLILMFMNFLISKKKMSDREKTSPFECGFDPFTSPRLPFSIQFYMISIIFLIFDVEVVIFFPMIPSFNHSNNEIWLYNNFYFIMILLIGIYIEWNDGALTWLK